MVKLTSNCAILREEVKTQVEFDLLVAVARASGMPLADQRFDVNDYNSNYLTFISSYSHITQTYYINNRELITFNSAIFSLAESSWTHIWQGKISEIFYYGDSEKIYFDISQIKTVPGDLVGKCCSLISTREVAAVELPKPKLAVGDKVLWKGVESKVVVNVPDKFNRLIVLLASGAYKQAKINDIQKVIPLREQIIAVLDDQDYCSGENADRLLKLFNITEKN
jgi:hypothetical protein